jgi:hypothetical protein
VVETNIHYPSDSSLLGDGVRVLIRTMKKITEIGAVTVPSSATMGGQLALVPRRRKFLARVARDGVARGVSLVAAHRAHSGGLRCEGARVRGNRSSQGGEHAWRPRMSNTRKIWIVVLFALWTILPPIWFLCEWKWLSPPLSDHEKLENFKHGQELARNLWLGIGALIGLLIGVRVKD